MKNPKLSWPKWRSYLQNFVRFFVMMTVLGGMLVLTSEYLSEVYQKIQEHHLQPLVTFCLWLLSLLLAVWLTEASITRKASSSPLNERRFQKPSAVNNNDALV